MSVVDMTRTQLNALGIAFDSQPFRDTNSCGAVYDNGVIFSGAFLEKGGGG